MNQNVISDLVARLCKNCDINEIFSNPIKTGKISLFKIHSRVFETESKTSSRTVLLYIK
jgi:hypothetical protein